MSTLEALNAISEAIEAHKLLPDIQRQLKEAREAHDFAMLELDEAREEINRLRDKIMNLDAKLEDAEAGLKQKDTIISELNDRNTSLDTSLTDVTRLYNDAQHTLANKEQIINILFADKAALLIRLEDSKGVVARLTDTLKSIGASIVAAVEVPEVTPSAPFPVSNPVGLPNPTDAELEHILNSEPAQPVAEPTGETVVEPITEGKFPAEVVETSPGTYAYRYW